MLNRIKILLIFLLLFFQNYLIADITVTSKIDTTIATVGDQVTLDISVLYPKKNTTISFPDINEEMQKFSVISRSESRVEKIANGFQKDFQFKIAVFDTGKIELPSLSVQTQVDSAEALRFKTSTKKLNVISVLPPDENVQPKDIKMPFPLPTILPWDFIFLALILISIAILWIILHKKWKKEHPQVDFNEKYLDPPHIIALRKLKEIANLPFVTEQEIIKVYTSISYIMREYLENRFFIRALEMPTRDIVESTKNVEFDTNLILELQDVLNRLDVIKFANQLPVESERDNIIAIVEKIINITKIDNFLSQRSGLTDIKESLNK